MKQTKKKSQKSEKEQPIKVQLSKDDLKELLTVLKNFIVDELLCYRKQDTQRFIVLELSQARLKSEIRERILGELNRQRQRLFLNSSENAKQIMKIKAREEKNAVIISNEILGHSRRINTLEIVEDSHRKELHKLKQHCAHEDKLDHINYGRASGTILTVTYKCVRCKREDDKMLYRLSRKEKRALRRLGVKI